MSTPEIVDVEKTIYFRPRLELKPETLRRLAKEAFKSNRKAHQQASWILERYYEAQPKPEVS